MRYQIFFKDNGGNAYEIQISQQGYAGAVSELRGTPSCFVVSGADDDFIYSPSRLTTATLSILDSDLLLDLYSINNQFAPVKLLRNGVLEWTGYVKPEQFTQPFRPYPQTISIECVSALSTLENIEYKQTTENGFIKLWDLLRNLIASAGGGYRGVYIPSVYGSNANVDSNNILAQLEANEPNFTSDKKNNLEVLEAIMKLMNWTITEMHGYIYIIDADWKGNYKLYDEALSDYTLVNWNELQVQEIGYNGADANTLDVVPGYNKATVKSINNVFDQVIDQEDYDTLEVAQRDYYEENLQHWDKQFLRPQKMKMYYYDLKNVNVPLTQEQIEALNINTQVAGGVLMKIAVYKDKIVNGEQVPDVEEYPWVNAIQLDAGTAYLYPKDAIPVFTVYGANSVWQDGALSVNLSIVYTTGIEKRLYYLLFDGSRLKCKMKIGDHSWTGRAWEQGDHTFNIEVLASNKAGFNSIKGNKTPDMPYDNLSGHIIELPQDRALKGKLEFTLYFDSSVGDIFNVGAIIKDLRIEYSKRTGEYDEGENGDRVYENIVNENYMSECDEVVFDLGSYNKDGATYSKVLINDVFLQNQIYNAITEESIRPEELMIRRIVNRYKVTKIKLTEALRNEVNLSPMSILTDRSMPGKRFILQGYEVDFEQNRLTVQMQEDVWD